MENNYSNLNIDDLTLLLSVTTEQLARRIRMGASCYTYDDGIVRSTLLNDLRSIRMEILQRVRASGKIGRLNSNLSVVN